MGDYAFIDVDVSVLGVGDDVHLLGGACFCCVGDVNRQQVVCLYAAYRTQRAFIFERQLVACVAD